MKTKVRDCLIAYAIKYKGDASQIGRAYLDHEKIDLNDYDFKGNAITLFDDEYPMEFARLERAPLVLFYKGDISLLKKLDKVAIIGGDRNNYSTKAADSLAKQKAREGKIIISDLLYCNEILPNITTKSIVVSSCGIECNTATGDADLVISEYPSEIRSDDDRNNRSGEIIAALSDTTYIMSSLNCHSTGRKSKEYNAISVAASIDKEVKVLPYHLFNIYGKSNNYLIDMGAKCISYKDIGFKD